MAATPTTSVSGVRILTKLNRLEKDATDEPDSTAVFDNGITHCGLLVHWAEAVFNQPAARSAVPVMFSFSRPPIECNCIWSPVLIRILTHAHHYIVRSQEQDTCRVISTESCSVRLRETRQVLGFVSYLLNRVQTVWVDMDAARMGVTWTHVKEIHAILRSLAIWHAAHLEFLESRNLQQVSCEYPGLTASADSARQFGASMNSATALSAIRMLYTSFHILATSVPAAVPLSFVGDGDVVFEHKTTLEAMCDVPTARIALKCNKESAKRVDTWPALASSQWLNAFGWYHSGVANVGVSVACFRLSVLRGCNCSRLALEESSLGSFGQTVPDSVSDITRTITISPNLLKVGTNPFDWTNADATHRLCSDLLPFRDDEQTQAAGRRR